MQRTLPLMVLVTCHVEPSVALMSRGSLLVVRTLFSLARIHCFYSVYLCPLLYICLPLRFCCTRPHRSGHDSSKVCPVCGLSLLLALYLLKLRLKLTMCRTGTISLSPSKYARPSPLNLVDTDLRWNSNLVRSDSSSGSRIFRLRLLSSCIILTRAIHPIFL